MKASAFRRWPVAGAYSLEQTTRLTGGSDLSKFKKIFPTVLFLVCPRLNSRRKKSEGPNTIVQSFFFERILCLARKLAI